ETIPTTFYFYIWIALSFAAYSCTREPAKRVIERRALMKSLRIPATFAAIAASAGMAWYAERNWSAENRLMEAGQAAHLKDEQKLLASRERAERAMSQVGTYHLESAGLVSEYIQDNRNSLNESSRLR